MGQCSPCNVVVDDVIAERNAIGYYGTNASGSVYVVNSIFRNNRLGLTPNSQEMERLSPQVETFVVGNLVVDNDDPNTPKIGQWLLRRWYRRRRRDPQFVIEKNRVSGHSAFGIGLVELNPFRAREQPGGRNVLADNAIDLAYLPAKPVPRPPRAIASSTTASPPRFPTGSKR